MIFFENLSIILPDKTNGGAPLDYEKHLKAACKTFGGYTLTPASGGWVDQTSGILYEDRSQKMNFSFDVLDAGKIATVRLILSDLLSPTFGGQEAVFFEIAGRSCFISSEKDICEIAGYLEKNYSENTVNV